MLHDDIHFILLLHGDMNMQERDKSSFKKENRKIKQYSGRYWCAIFIVYEWTIINPNVSI
jgi:hypothetical protein